MLTGLQFSILSRSFFLKIGLTDAVFASSENESFRRSLLIIFVRCESIILADSLTIFGRILSGPVAFFAFNCFIILFICSEVAVEMSNVFLRVFLLLIFKILGCVLYFRIIDCTVLFLDQFTDQFCFQDYPQSLVDNLTFSLQC